MARREKKRMERKTKVKLREAGITLVALVVTIIVLLILAGISLRLVLGNQGLIEKAKNASTVMENAKISEMTKMNEFEADIDEQTANYIGSGVEFGSIYTDDMIGQKINYSANGQTNWIILGKDGNGNILITTEQPIENGFYLKGGAESWIKYKSNTDQVYGLNYACSGYGKTIQGVQLNSRSISMEDINNLVGLKPKSVTVGGNTYDIQSFETFSFGTESEWWNRKIDYYYPILTGGTLGDGTGTGFWKKPTSDGEEAFKDEWYRYYKEGDEYYYKGVETGGNPISAETAGININNLKYVWGRR